MMTQGLEVDLPEATTKALRQQEEPLVVTIRKEGDVYLKKGKDDFRRPAAAVAGYAG